MRIKTDLNEQTIDRDAFGNSIVLRKDFLLKSIFNLGSGGLYN